MWKNEKMKAIITSLVTYSAMLKQPINFPKNFLSIIPRLSYSHDSSLYWFWWVFHLSLYLIKITYYSSRASIDLLMECSKQDYYNLNIGIAFVRLAMHLKFYVFIFWESYKKRIKFIAQFARICCSLFTCLGIQLSKRFIYDLKSAAVYATTSIFSQNYWIYFISYRCVFQQRKKIHFFVIINFYRIHYKQKHIASPSQASWND